ncbi:MAG: hypothetical protein JOZ22_06445 [Acidobacteriia bacterium]|nr:hypothetical protein [Terriglobia bacterium]MBV9404387.1 hypothetical protein [Acidobacteriaceae bacterium]
MLIRSATVLLLIAGYSFGQTNVNILNQVKNPDFSAYPFTRPITVGTALPSTCQVGQLFFNSAAAAGANLYACTATNVWSLEAGGSSGTGGNGGTGSGASFASQLGDFSTSLSNGTLTIGSGCSASTPCNVRVGNTVYSFKNSATVTSSGSTSGLVFIYVDSAGNLTAGSTATLNCSGCLYVSGITAFPAGSIPLANWTDSAGSLAAGSGVDFRAFLSNKAIASGPGILVSENSGVSTISIDPSVASTYVATPPSTSSSTCSVGQFSVDSNYYYFCAAANVWKRIAWGSSF